MLRHGKRSMAFRHNPGSPSTKEQAMAGRRRGGLDPAQLDALCGRWPGVTRDIKWETRRVYSVDGKMFAMTAEDPDEPFYLYVKVPDERFLELTDRTGIVPAPYLARAHWVRVAEPARSGGRIRTCGLTRSGRPAP
jgi:predicted DNA-binding protein (MmcQ/YjbR family)